jgi:hypothetical protein
MNSSHPIMLSTRPFLLYHLPHAASLGTTTVAFEVEEMKSKFLWQIAALTPTPCEDRFRGVNQCQMASQSAFVSTAFYIQTIIHLDSSERIELEIEVCLSLFNLIRPF